MSKKGTLRTVSVRPGRAAPIGLHIDVEQYWRQQILEKSRDLFFSKGYSTTTLEQIAESLGATKAFVYLYFHTKRDILHGVCEIGVNKATAALKKEMAKALTPKETLRLIAEKVTEITIENQKDIVVYIREEMNLDPSRAEEIMLQRREFDRRIQLLLEEGVERGEFSVDNTDMMAVTIGGVFTWVARWFRPHRDSKADAVQGAVDVVLRMVDAQSR